MDDLDGACDAVQSEIIHLQTQLRWARSAEELWATRYADLQRDRDRLRHTLASTQDINTRWEQVAREMHDEREQVKAENLRLRRLLKAFADAATEPCRFDHLGECQEHDAGKHNGACAVAVVKALLHE